MSKVNFVEVVKKLLKHYTQTELHKKTGVAQSTISDLNTGKEKKNLTYTSAKALLDALAELEETTS